MATGTEGGGEGGVGREVGGRWVAPNRTAPTGTSSKETAGNATRTEPNRNTHVYRPYNTICNTP